MTRLPRVDRREFGRYRLPEDDGAGRTQLRDARGIRHRLVVRVNGRPVGRGHVDGIDDVFDADDDAVERTSLAVTIARSGVCERLLGIEIGPSPDGLFARCYAFEAGADGCFGRLRRRTECSLDVRTQAGMGFEPRI
jgi:hypothetical protein